MMRRLGSRLDTRSAEFLANAAHHRGLAAELRERQRKARFGRPQRDLDRLARGRKARVQLEVSLYGNERKGAVFNGIYLVLPPAHDNALMRGDFYVG